MIVFATFHISLQPSPSLSNISTDYQTTINLMFQSVSLFHRAVRKFVLSDLDTDFSQLSSDIVIQRYDIDTQSMMLSRLDTQTQFLKTVEPESSVVLLDSDMLLNGSLDHLLQQPFDLGLTIRDPAPVHQGRPMPINGGIFFIPAKGKSAAIHFLENLQRIYRDRYSDSTQWWGDQYALAEILQRSGTTDLHPGNLELDGTCIYLLDCDRYNFSPELESELDFARFEDSLVLHFKGPRKRFMQLYWDQFLAPNRQILPLEEAQKLLEKKVNLLQKDRFALKHKIQELKQTRKALVAENKRLVATNADLSARLASPKQYIRHLFKQLRKRL